MTTNKPTIIGYTATKRGELIGEGGFTLEDFTAELRDNPAGLKLEPIILLRDYEALKTAHEEELFQVRQDRDAHFGELMRALEQVDAMKAECAKLRRDAERYRRLREQCGSSGLLTIAKVGAFELKAWSGDDPDTAIDAAIQEERNP